MKRRARRARCFGGGFDDAQHGEALQPGSQPVESALGLSGDSHRSCGWSEGSLGRVEHVRASNSHVVLLGDEGAFEGFRVGLCCRRAHAESDEFGRHGPGHQAREFSLPLTIARSLQRFLGSGMLETALRSEVLTFAWCARSFA